VFLYDEMRFHSEEAPVEEAIGQIGRSGVIWISIDGGLDCELMSLIGAKVGIDPGEMSSVIAFSRGRARMEDLGDTAFLVWSTANRTDGSMDPQPSYYLLGPNYMISVQEGEDHYAEVVDRLRNEGSRLRKSGPGFLLYSILNATAEEFFDRMEELSDSIGELEDLIISDSNHGVLVEIGRMRGRIGFMWRTIWPLREASASLAERPTSVMGESDRAYFSELFSSFDLLLHEIDSLDQIIPQLIDLYESSTTRQLNQIVKVLTLFSVLFAPLTLMVGIYSMNFENIPGQDHPLGYSFLMFFMLIVSALMLLYFYRKGWLGSRERG